MTNETTVKFLNPMGGETTLITETNDSTDYTRFRSCITGIIPEDWEHYLRTVDSGTWDTDLSAIARITLRRLGIWTTEV